MVLIDSKAIYDVIGLMIGISSEQEYTRDGKITKMFIVELTDHRFRVKLEVSDGRSTSKKKERKKSKGFHKQKHTPPTILHYISKVPLIHSFILSHSQPLFSAPSTHLLR
ncbi:hypothetical protein P8452_71801 [Trifolium repens]|nr:hypothetical protein P8452_71801 [Trifolium repens]